MVVLGRVPGGVEGTFVAAFAEHDANVAGGDTAADVAVIKGLEDGGLDEEGVCRGAELVDFEACCCGKELGAWDRAELGELIGPGKRVGDVEGGEELVELGLGG